MEQESFYMDFDIEDIRLLYHCVCKKIENWEGYPSRPIMEQTHLCYLKTELYKVILDHKFYEM